MQGQVIINLHVQGEGSYLDGEKEGCKIIIWKAGKWPTVDNVFDECHAPCTIK